MNYQNILYDQGRSQTMANYVSGSERPKYFRRPLVPQMQDIAVLQQQSPQQIIQNQQQKTEEQITIEPKTKDQQIQTDYRESEAQTDPYTPKYVLRDGENPEVLQLANLKWGKGLPASLEEIEQIEMTREKEWFENSLPPISDEASFSLRRQLMEHQEHREWNKKEDEIKKLHNEKLYLLQSALIEREKEVEDKNAKRIEEIKQRKTEQKNRLIAKIQRRKIKVMRKMLKSRKKLEQDTPQRDIIEDYANFASRVYAGITREGLSLDKLANKYEVQPVALTTYQGIRELADQIKPSELQTNADIKKIEKNIAKTFTRMEKAHRTEIEKAKQDIQNVQQQKTKVVDDKTDDAYDLKQIKKQIRPPTPTFKYDENFSLQQVPPDLQNYKTGANLKLNEQRRERAVVLIQRLLRGRHIQNIMYEGKEKRLALIDELLTVAKIENMPEEEADEILMQNHEEKVKNSVIESLQGEVISETLDQLSKELLRIKQERKIAQMVKVAENDRRLREIEEAGKRQAGEILRQREDVLYNEMMRVHQGSVDTYLNWILNNTLEKASTRQATIMANLRRQKMNKPLEDFERKYNNNETIIKDLVHAFLIPNVQRNKIIRQIKIEEKRFNEAAKDVLKRTVQQSSNQIQEEALNKK